jgi:hypothetical protein
MPIGKTGLSKKVLWNITRRTHKHLHISLKGTELKSRGSQAAGSITNQTEVDEQRQGVTLSLAKPQIFKKIDVLLR